MTPTRNFLDPGLTPWSRSHVQIARMSRYGSGHRLLRCCRSHGRPQPPVGGGVVPLQPRRLPVGRQAARLVTRGVDGDSPLDRGYAAGTPERRAPRGEGVGRPSFVTHGGPGRQGVDGLAAVRDRITGWVLGSTTRTDTPQWSLRRRADGPTGVGLRPGWGRRGRGPDGAGPPLRRRRPGSRPSPVPPGCRAPLGGRSRRGRRVRR